MARHACPFYSPLGAMSITESPSPVEKHAVMQSFYYLHSLSEREREHLVTHICVCNNGCKVRRTVLVKPHGRFPIRNKYSKGWGLVFFNYYKLHLQRCKFGISCDCLAYQPYSCLQLQNGNYFQAWWSVMSTLLSGEPGYQRDAASSLNATHYLSTPMPTWKPLTKSYFNDNKVLLPLSIGQSAHQLCISYHLEHPFPRH